MTSRQKTILVVVVVAALVGVAIYFATRPSSSPGTLASGEAPRTGVAGWFSRIGTGVTSLAAGIAGAAEESQRPADADEGAGS